MAASGPKKLRTESPLGTATPDEKTRLRGMTDDELFTEREVLVSKANTLAAEYNKLKRGITSIRDELRRRKDPDAPVISDHAVLRYLERYMGIDTVSVRKAITEMAKTRIAEKKTQIVQSGDLNLAIRDNRVCTIWPSTPPQDAP